MYGHSVQSTLIRCHFSPKYTTGQRFCFTGSADGNIYIYDLSGQCVSMLSDGDQLIRDVSWHPYWMQLTATCWNGQTVNWTYHK